MVKSDRKFDVGDDVMGKWPSTNLYFQGTVLDYNEVQYLVQFNDEDKSEFPIDYTDVLGQYAFSRRSRSSSRSRGRTPTRKSPARKTPKKSSPGRPPRKTSSSRTRLNSESHTVETKTTSTSTTTVRRKSGKVPVRQSARISELQDKTEDVVDSEVNTLKVDTALVTKAIEEQKTIKGLLKRLAFGVWYTLISNLQYILMLCYPFVLTQMCTKTTCILAVPAVPTKLKYYYSPKSIYLVCGFLLLNFLISLLPLGKEVQHKSAAKHRCNAVYALLLTAVGVSGLMYLNFNVLGLYFLYRHTLVASMGLAVLLASLLYVKSFYSPKGPSNPSGNTGYFVVDFMNGREVTPTLFNVNLKMLLLRTAILTSMFIQFMVFMRHMQTGQGNFSITLLCATLLQFFYCAEWLVFEETILTSYEHNTNGFGLIALTEYAGIPFIMAFIQRFILNHGKELPWYGLLAVTLVFCIGYVMCRGANAQKHAFKFNPANPAVAHLESIPASGGRRLLVSGWWGTVRHPNYVGDFLIMLSWTLLCGFELAMPWLLLATNFVYLCARTHMVETDCKQTYGLAWSTYTSRVPYRLIPKIY